MVVERFLEQLAAGALVPGERLPPERELAASYGVGRNSVREAIRELEMLGVVETRQGDGTYVTEISAQRLMTPFRALLGIQAPTAAISEILEFRGIIEPEAAALAARNLTEDNERLLRRALQRFDSSLVDGGPAVVDGGPAVVADTHFHFAIAQASGNPLIIAVQRALLDIMSGFRSNLPADSSYVPDQRLPRGHHAIFGAIIAGDPESARQAMAEHLRDVAEELRR